MSTQIDLGPVLSIPKGDWNASTTYERLNLVRHNSAAWICNVDTSIGVEPSEDSVDWFLQVKDTSAVSSVNGMRGDVEITTIQTPSNDSNDTSIANTEWVRDRIDETINSTHSYTDNAVSAATTSILDTAAQDASNKATIAVNQALAASETKFAAKDVVNNLVDDVNSLTENDNTQDEAIANKLNKNGDTMTGDLTIRSDGPRLCLRNNNIPAGSNPSTNQYSVFRFQGEAAQQVANVEYRRGIDGQGRLRLSAINTAGTSSPGLDIIINADGTSAAQWNSADILTSAGGTMTGALSIQDNELHLKTSSYARGTIPSSDIHRGIKFLDKNNNPLGILDNTIIGTSGRGRTRILAYDYTGSDAAIFQVIKDPVTGEKYALMNENRVLTSTGGKVGELQFTDNNLVRTISDNYLRIWGSRGVDNDGANLILFGKDHNSGWGAGGGGIIFYLPRENGTNESVYFQANGNHRTGNGPFAIITNSWYTNTSWGMVLSNGFKIQGGRVANSNYGPIGISFNVPFTSYVFPIGMASIATDPQYSGESYHNLTLTGLDLYHRNATTCWAVAGF